MNFARRRPKVYRDRINPIEYFDEVDFKARYRLSKQAVRVLAEDFANSEYISTFGDGRGSVVSPIERMCAALRYFATGANYRTVSDYQGISKSTLARCIDEVVRYLCSKTNDFIVWPTGRRELEDKAVEFFHKQGKPCTIGCIDGTQVAILRPARNLEFSYLNRKVYHSINVMIVCDASNYILWVDERFPGSCHDSYVLLSSAIEPHGNQGHMEGFWMLGDSGYSQKPWLMVPFRNAVTPGERAYNVWHRSARSCVERTIGLLKQRWRCLHTSAGYLVHEPLKASKIILACCVLHNIANREGDVIQLDQDDDGRIPRARQMFGHIIDERNALPDNGPHYHHHLENEHEQGLAARQRFVQRAFLNNFYV